MSKKSIRFFNDREVRAVWDDENNCWWYSATDVVRAINDESDYTKAGNYWRWIKRKLTQDGIQLVSMVGMIVGKWRQLAKVKPPFDIFFVLICPANS